MGEAMATLSNVGDVQIVSVVQEFVQNVGKISPIGIGTGDFTRRVMVQALGESKARNMLGRVMQAANTKGMDALKWMDARSVVSWAHTAGASANRGHCAGVA